LRGDIVMSAYSYIEDDGVVLLPLDQRWPLEPMLTAAQFAHYGGVDVARCSF
jgi:hypothetical protein